MARNTGDLPRVLNQRKAQRLLEEHGWSKEAGGKHVVKMVKAGNRPITLPAAQRQDYSVSLTSRILRAAGLKGTDQEDDG